MTQEELDGLVICIATKGVYYAETTCDFRRQSDPDSLRRETEYIMLRNIIYSLQDYDITSGILSESDIEYLLELAILILEKCPNFSCSKQQDTWITTIPAPNALPATSVDYEGFDANWEGVENATGYFLDVSSDPDFGSFLSGFNNLNVGNVLTYNIDNLDAETNYYYRLRASTTVMTSTNSNIINITTGTIYDQGDILLVDRSVPCKVYAYNPITKESILLSIPDLADTWRGSSMDIAHTPNKLWLYQQPASSSDLGEWDITLNPFTAFFNRYITGEYANAGLHAINDTKLITYARMSGYYETDVTNTPCTQTLKFSMTDGRNVNGDYMLTTTGKLISLEAEYDSPYKTHIVQYDYATGVKELDLDISSIFKSPFIESGPAAYGLFEHNGNIYIASCIAPYMNTGGIYKIDKTSPYEITLYDTVAYGINGASQLAYRITEHFIV